MAETVALPGAAAERLQALLDELEELSKRCEAGEACEADLKVTYDCIELDYDRLLDVVRCPAKIPFVSVRLGRGEVSLSPLDVALELGDVSISTDAECDVVCVTEVQDGEIVRWECGRALALGQPLTAGELDRLVRARVKAVVDVIRDAALL
jgi:hypothetical protein